MEPNGSKNANGTENGTAGTTSLRAMKRTRSGDLVTLPRCDSSSSIEDMKNTHKSVLSTFLSIKGGSEGKEQRDFMQQMLADVVSKLELPQPAELAPRDVVWASDDLCFVGVGVHTNFVGIRESLQQDIWKSRRIAVVRDVFDRSPTHAFLDHVLRMITDDVIVVLSDAFEFNNRRLVNEYIQGSDRSYTLHRHDINLITYLHENGFRIIRVPTPEALQSYSVSSIPIQQSTNHVMMIAPTAFESSILRARQDGYLDPFTDLSMATDDEIQAKALLEFADLHALVTEKAGVQVHLFTHERYHDTPDAVFPNNWFSTHTDLEVGECTLVLYPLHNPNRRKERRPEFRKRLGGFRRYRHVFDLTNQESEAKPGFLEGTGSLVLDRANHVAYVALSERSHLAVAERWCDVMGYELVAFTASKKDGAPVLHTDEMLMVGTSCAVVSAEAITEPELREKVLDRLGRQHDVITITREQLAQNCGSIVELESWDSTPVLLMSSTAYRAFTPSQRERLAQHAPAGVLHSDLRTIEVIGGGGIRALIAELF